MQLGAVENTLPVGLCGVLNRIRALVFVGDRGSELVELELPSLPVSGRLPFGGRPEGDDTLRHTAGQWRCLAA